MSNSPQPFMRIGRRLVGPPGSVYVIAEAGVNHDGDIDVARQLIAAAANTGADAVKFQVFSADRLVTRQAPSTGYQQRAGESESQHEMLARLELAHGQFEELSEYARRFPIDFFATPFSIPDLDFLVSLGVPVLKLASPDIVNGPLLDAAAQSGLAVIASTGAATLDEVTSAVERFMVPGAGPLSLLHCVSSYPAREEEANLAVINELARRFHCISGFSDHTESLTIGGLAVAAGAKIVEKHLTLDRHRRGPDHSFSLEPEVMTRYVNEVRRVARMMGDGQPGPTSSQREVRRLGRSSIVAARNIAPGEVIHQNMLTTKRPGGGISPMRINELVGRKVLRIIPADTPITWESLLPAAITV